MAVIKQTVAIGVDITGDEAAAQIDKINNSAKTLKQQLKEATVEAMKFGDATSKEALEAQKRVAALKEEMSDFKDRINALNPEAKFAAVSKLASGVAGGFAAAQGAMALFGSESEELQKSLLKVQAALALSQGINEIKGLGDAFKNLKIVGLDAIKSLWTAIVASPLAALLVTLASIGAALSYWLATSKEGIGVQASLIEANIKRLEIVEQGYDREIALARAAGKEVGEIEEKKLQAVIKRLKEQIRLEELTNNKLIQDQYDLMALYGQSNEGLSRALFSQEKTDNDKLKELRKGLAEAELALDVKVIEEKKKNHDAYIAYRKKQFEDLKDADAKLNEDLKESEDQVNKERDKDFDKLRIKVEDNVIAPLRKLPEVTNEAVDESISAFDRFSAASDRLATFLNGNFGKISSGITSTIGEGLNVATAFYENAMNKQLKAAAGNEAEQDKIKKKFFERNKKAQIAQASMAMFTGAVEAYKSTVGIPIVGPFLAPVAAGFAIAAGVENIGRIRQQQYEGGADGGGSMNAPSLDGAGGGFKEPKGTQINPDGSTGTQNAGNNSSPQIATKVYVVASEVENVNNLNSQITKLSTV